MKFLLFLLGLLYVTVSDDYVARGIRRELVRAGRYVTGRAMDLVFT